MSSSKTKRRGRVESATRSRSTLPGARSRQRRRRVASVPYVAPYDRREQHLPGYNFCGPGTNVHRRLRDGVRPVNALDRAALSHDLVTERRGPYNGRGSPSKMRAADRKLLAAAHTCLRQGTAPRGDCLAVIAAMEFVLATGVRGRRYPRY